MLKTKFFEHHLIEMFFYICYMNDNYDTADNNDVSQLLEKFEAMLCDDHHYFFDVNDFQELIHHYIAKADLDKAFKVLHYAKLQHPYSTEITLHEAGLLIESGEPAKALDILENAGTSETSDIDTLMLRASACSLLGKYTEAIEHIQRAIDNADEDPDDLYFALALEYENNGDYDKAIKALEKAVYISPENPDLLYELSFCYEQSGHLIKGIDFFIRFIDEYPYSAEAWYNLGYIYFRSELYEKSADAYDYAIVAKEDFIPAYFGKANALTELKQYSDAIEIYKESIKFHAPDAEVYYLIGECYEKAENYQRAIAYYRKAIKFNPDMGEAWLGAGVVLDCLDRQREAKHFIRRAVEIEKNNGEFWYLYANILRSLGEYNEAVKAYEKSVTLSPENINTWLDFSTLYYDNANISEAFRTISRGINFHYGSSEFYYKAAGYLFMAGFEEEGLELLKDALQIDPGNHSILFESFPETQDDPRVLELIDSFVNRK